MKRTIKQNLQKMLALRYAIALVIFLLVASKASAISDTLDLTSKFTSMKIANGTKLLHTANANFKVYAVYKNGIATEWYAVDNSGKRYKPTQQTAKSATECTGCVISPTGTVICVKCTVGISAGTLPTKRN